MATLILVRHGRTTANASGVLAGRTPGVLLDETGESQVRATGQRLAAVPVRAVVTSPLERCRQTAAAIVAAHPETLRVSRDAKITECDYGDWQGRPIKELLKEPMWKVVQQQPSAAVFPNGESMRAMQDRAVNAVRRHDRQVGGEHGDDAVWVAVSHGDIIKSILADALGTHLDQFQRIVVDPSSVSIIRYTDTRPYVLASNTHAGDLSWLNPPKRARRRRAATDAVVGGGAGPGAAGARS